MSKLPEDIKIDHELKVWPNYMDDILSGKKNFEVRKLDRLFGTNQILLLREWSPVKWPETDGYSGRECYRRVTYFMNGGQWGLAEGNCIMGIVPISQPIEGRIPETKNEPDWKAIAQDTAKRLSDGRDYLMQVEAKKITVEDALEAFGFGRSGLNF